MNDNLNELPPTISVAHAARILGVSRKHAYDCARRGEIPTIQLGHRKVVPSPALLAMLNGRKEGNE